MNGGSIDHPGEDFWGLGLKCAGENAHYKEEGSHNLCCSQPNFERQGFCRYTFLEDHINKEI